MLLYIYASFAFVLNLHGPPPPVTVKEISEVMDNQYSRLNMYQHFLFNRENFPNNDAT